MNTNFLNYFTGKSLENAKAALAMVEESLVHGSWVKGASRKVPAALSKANLAIKLGKANEGWLERLGVPAGENRYNDKYRATADQGWEIAFGLRYGNFAGLARVDFALAKSVATPEQLVVIEKAEQIAADFAEIVAAVKKLDASKPVPTFTKLGASPTVTRTLESLEVTAVNVCPMEYFQVERVNAKTGKTEIVTLVRLLWPAGIKHGTSRFSHHNDQCEACGHGIRNVFNWVPLVLTAKDGSEKSLWVGRDCAETLFGVKLTGELEIVKE